MKRLTTILIILCAMQAAAYAKNIYDLEKYLKGYSKTYFLYVDKKINILYLVDKNLKIWRKYPVATGVKKGEKLYSYDLKTPAGVYYIKEIWQYNEPWYLTEFKKKAAASQDGSGEKKYYDGNCKQIERKYIKNRKKIKQLNETYLSAGDGHVKYGTGKSLGYDSYGPVFMLLDYPNSQDIERYQDALDDGLVPRDDAMYYADQGCGIAIHGTNDNGSLGKNASSGCVRMRNDYIKELSRYVMEGTMVIID